LLAAMQTRSQYECRYSNAIY